MCAHYSTPTHVRVGVEFLQAYRLRITRTTARTATPNMVFEPRHDRTARPDIPSVFIKTEGSQLRQGSPSIKPHTGRYFEEDSGESDSDVGGEEGGHKRVWRIGVAERQQSAFEGERTER